MRSSMRRPAFARRIPDGPGSRQSAPSGPAACARRLRPAVLLLAVVLALLPLLADAAPGTTRIDWGTPAPMPTGVQHVVAAAAANGKVYVVGGSIPNAFSEYDPATNTWSAKALMPTARSQLGLAAAANGKVYAIGGQGGETVVEEYDPATDSWTTDKAPMPTGRRFLGLAAANGKLYAVGGVGGETVVQEYDPAADSWSTKAPMPTPRVNLGLATASNGKLYAVGGINDTGVVGAVEEYDPATNTWTAKAPMPTARQAFGLAAHLNGKLYAVGGQGEGGALAVVQEYDPATNTWAAKPQMQIARHSLGLATAPNGKLYAIGGFTNVIILALVEEYDPATRTWATPPALTAMPTGRAGVGLATGANGRLYAIGGFTGATYLAVNEEYDPSANGWQARAPMPGGPRSGLGVAAHPNGLIYAVGGSNGGYLGRTEAYNPAANTWQGGLDDLNTPRVGPGVAVGSDGLVYAVGGYNGTDRNNVEAYNPATNTWTNRQALGVARQLPALVATPDGSLYAIGGFNNAQGGAQKTVEKYTIATNTWVPVASMGTARYSLNAILGPNGRIYAVGGQANGSTFLDVVEEYDPATNTWRTVAPMPTARSGFGLALGPDKRAFAVGGYDGNPGLTGLTVVEELRFTELPSASAGGPYSVPAGSTAPVNVSASGADPEGSALSFAWDLNGDLLYESPGQGQSISVAGRAAGTYPLRVSALDNPGAYAVATTTLTVTGPTRLAFATQPAGAPAGQPLSRQPVVQAVDEQGRVVPAFNGQVTLAFGTNAGAGILGGTATVNAVNGVATFTDLLVSAPGNGYTLVASAPSLASATSDPFSIGVPPTHCNPRPNVRVTSTPVGPGQLRATILTGTSAATPVNGLVGLRLTRVENAVVTLNGSPLAVGNAVPVPGGSSEVSLLVQRQVAGSATTVAFVVTDACGDWPTLVGGGPGAF